MIKGQIIVYHYNGLYNNSKGFTRNNFTIKDIELKTKEEFPVAIADSLDEVPPGQGYALVKWNNRMFICEKDLNNPTVDYIRHEISYHPLMNNFK